ncbi:hypothetical protein BHECKSOX_1614 [Bathymodiolus heckerae thiotrophic gill symbiont]|uniref:hypothetical protein n=1 Tax=Bathymodiolus heckerae thiotrophic gill symbiont TaxID=1052212 RepID=UPI0010B3BF9B|nr:hypothetical protein [Bathymodiolus heckerae thiotrophic gill symbiont]SHN91325.1 hypothetical protein BHECKSOX_1614 [Bathymodiolus heckerae thiotrophic gill symbiont]
MKLFISKTKFNLILLGSIISLSILSVSWHHQAYTLYKDIKRENIKNHQIVALNKQLLSEYSQVMSGEEIKETALQKLGLKEVEADDLGKWYKGRISL